MSQPQRGRNHRTAAPLMPKFLASEVSDPVKAGVAEAVAELNALWAEDPQAVIPPDMLLWMNPLLGSATIETIDLLRILTMLPPHEQAHTRENLGALLRGKQGLLGRPLTSEDFPSGHAMHLFASAYWGGIAAWSAGGTCRAQLPKGHWARKANRLAAIEEFATAHPETPITQPNLHAAGLHRLAKMLTVAELEALVAEAGLNRQLRRLPNRAGRWTQEVVIDAYVDLCRAWGVTLSSAALGAMKGMASTLRGHARRAFGTFRAMVDASVRAHTDLQPPTRCVAKDGTRLDSQAEVVTWNAVRTALPGVAMVPHVILPGETKRSADIVPGGEVYLEVLMVAVAEMAEPHNAKVAAYAEKWSRKKKVYDQLGIRPVLFEPEDVYDPGRTAVRVAEITARLSTTPIPAAPAASIRIRPKGFWGFDGLCDAVAEVVGMANTDGALPTHAQLAEYGFGHAANLLKRRGMRARVCIALDLADPHAKNPWTRERVVTELADWCRAHGRYPGTDDVQPHGLKSAGYRWWPGQRAALQAEVTARLGVELPVKRAPNTSHDTLDDVAKLLEPLARQTGRLPTGAEYHAAGKGSAWSAASRKWGVAALARQLGLERPGRRRTGRECKDETPAKFW